MEPPSPNAGAVQALLADGSIVEAYWDGVCWMQGVENNPIDAVITQEVISWDYLGGNN